MRRMNGCKTEYPRGPSQALYIYRGGVSIIAYPPFGENVGPTLGDGVPQDWKHLRRQE